MLHFEGGVDQPGDVPSQPNPAEIQAQSHKKTHDVVSEELRKIQATVDALRRRDETLSQWRARLAQNRNGFGRGQERAYLASITVPENGQEQEGRDFIRVHIARGNRPRKTIMFNMGNRQTFFQHSQQPHRLHSPRMLQQMFNEIKMRYGNQCNIIAFRSGNFESGHPDGTNEIALAHARNAFMDMLTGLGPFEGQPELCTGIDICSHSYGTGMANILMGDAVAARNNTGLRIPPVRSFVIDGIEFGTGGSVASPTPVATQRTPGAFQHTQYYVDSGSVQPLPGSSIGLNFDPGAYALTHVIRGQALRHPQPGDRNIAIRDTNHQTIEDRLLTPRVYQEIFSELTNGFQEELPPSGTGPGGTIAASPR
ncbi:MAG: hypothetical protein HOO67_02185 [Candidatus Peribacteraceae bacterium]|nr:hypothetical protein [Candidatus Peribacteraceae bacterium]